MARSKINIVSKLPPEFNSTIVIDDITYHVHTEDRGPKKTKVDTRIFVKGEVVFSRSSDYSDLRRFDDFPKRLEDFMQRHHKHTVDAFVREQKKREKQKSHFFNEMKILLRKKDGEGALAILREGVQRFPGDPFLNSYYGCLISVVEKKHQEGITICKEAIDSLDKTVPFGSDLFYPVFYLNLGRAYLQKDKSQAIKSFRTGLMHDPENKEILWELKKMGTRKKPPVPFLKRSNPINKYIGMIISRTSKP